MGAPLTIKQRTAVVEIEYGQRIVVRRMVWRAARDLLTLIAEHRSQIGTNMQEAWARLPELLRSVDAIVEHLVCNSTDLSKEQYDQLDMVQALAVLEAAIELNLGDELKNSCVGIAHKLAGLAAGWMPTTPGANSMPSSSTGDMPPTTSTAAPSSTSS
jgi:hypothetical protein